MAKYAKIISLISFLTLFYRCANQLPPSGGVIDKIPPEIIETYPASGAINYSENFIEITFSEYIDERSVQDAIFISPAIDDEIEYDWSGKTLELVFPHGFKKNTTYTIAIGTDVVDINNRNNMAHAYTLSFSTGNVIDKNILKGKVFDKNPLGTFIFAYKTKLDSIPDITKIKPDYISQVGKSGEFELMGLGKGLYFLTAVKDELRNQLYEKGTDDIGLPSELYSINSIDTIISDINFTLSIDDTIPPSVSNVAMIDRNHFLLDFSETIDSSHVTKENFFVFDSTEGKIINSAAFFKNKTNQYYLCLIDSLKSENDNYLISENLIDLLGNKSGREVASFIVNTKPDTTKPKIKSISTEYENNKVDFASPYFNILFDDGIISAGLDNIFSIKEIPNSSSNFAYSMTDDAEMKLNYKGKLNPKSNYTLLIDTKKISDIAGNKMDSVYTIKFSTNNELDYGGVSGTVQSNSKGIMVELKNISSNKNAISQSVDSTGVFNFQKVKPGKYFLMSYIDSDSSKSYSKGKLKPFIHSEKFRYYPDTLNVRPRWPIGDIKLKID